MLRLIGLVEDGRGACRKKVFEIEDGVLDVGDTTVVLAALDDKNGEIRVRFGEASSHDACSCAAWRK